MPNACCPTLSDSAKNGPSTAIWVACARIAATLRVEVVAGVDLGRDLLVRVAEGQVVGAVDAEEVASPGSLSWSMPACSTLFGMAVQ